MAPKDKKVPGSNVTLAETVFQALRRDILMGVYRPSQKLLLHELKACYDAGGSPIREALLQLSWCRYVVMKPQRGFWVSPVSLHELNDILLVRRMIAEEAVSRSLQLGDETWELAMLTCYHRLSRIDLNDPYADLQVWADHHMAFHLSIISGCQSPMILDLMTSLYNQLERYRHIWFDPALHISKRYSDDGEHHAILQAALARDVGLTLALINQHYSHVMRVAEELNIPSG